MAEELSLPVLATRSDGLRSRQPVRARAIVSRAAASAPSPLDRADDLLHSALHVLSFAPLDASPGPAGLPDPVELSPSFRLLPVRGGNAPSATFTDRSGAFWTLAFGKEEERDRFACVAALAVDATRRAWWESAGVEDARLGYPATWTDLRLGEYSARPEHEEGPVVEGDRVKVRYTAYLPARRRLAVGARIASVGVTAAQGGGAASFAVAEPLVFTVGDGADDAAVPGLHRAVVGMRRRGRRFVVVPPAWTEGGAAVWLPHVPPGTPVLLEVALASIRPRSPRAGGESAMRRRAAEENPFTFHPKKEDKEKKSKPRREAELEAALAEQVELNERLKAAARERIAALQQRLDETRQRCREYAERVRRERAEEAAGLADDLYSALRDRLLPMLARGLPAALRGNGGGGGGDNNGEVAVAAALGMADAAMKQIMRDVTRARLEEKEG